MRNLVVKWNNQWKYDFWYRKKYNIPFNSEEHRAASQIDIAFEYHENKLFNESLEDLKIENDKKEDFKKNGLWKVSTELEDKIFENLDLDQFNE